MDFSSSSAGKESASNAGDSSLIPGSGRSTGEVFLGFPGGLVGKESACNVGHLGSIPGLGRSSGGRDIQQPTPLFWPGESSWTEEPGRLQSMRS